ncbi:AraC family transcriptional regulator [Maricurvus nonylphenolicus]|uniref:AraC family transcriptional regulator n=1 Tax=Maricurvus nonylphenolicus TaxID=1008307 RepID=UPI0036F23EE8
MAIATGIATDSNSMQQKVYNQEITFPEQGQVSLKSIAREVTEPWRVSNHFHAVCELVVYEDMYGEVWCGGQAQALASGQVLLVPPDTIHSFYVKPGRQLYHVLHFPLAELTRINPDFAMPAQALVLDLNPEDFHCLIALLKWCASEASEAVASSRMQALGLAVSMIFENGVERINTVARFNPSAFKPLVNYLNTHNCYQLSVDKAAELCHLSRSHFMKKFKKQYEVTFQQFLTQRKIDAAKSLLRSSSLSITEIAQHIEIDSLSYFSKLFKETEGCTPREYMARERGEA